jgi:L-ascorbate metabolism protein UlaG (beta-lactamase superfamily)
MERFPIRVTLLANAGVLIRYRGVSLLLDGIFGQKDNPFSPLPEGCREAMLRGEPPFQELDYLLFSHYHPDHFAPEMVRRLLERRPVRGLFYPRDDAPEVRQLSGWLRQEVIPCVLLSHKTDRAVIQIEPHISVQAFMTAHLGQEYRDVPHACYLLTFDGRRVLFTADTDYLHETLSHLSGTHLDAVFLNPLFYQACFNRRLFRGYFDTDTLCVYHVPFREDDRMHMQDMARRMPQAAREAGLRVLPLTEPMQQIEI